MLRRREYNFSLCTCSNLSRKRSVTQHFTEWMFGGSSKRVCQCVFFREDLKVDQQQKNGLGHFSRALVRICHIKKANFNRQ